MTVIESEVFLVDRLEGTLKGSSRRGSGAQQVMPEMKKWVMVVRMRQQEAQLRS